ncbi:MAG: aldolase catalytic domain-containing protein [Ilumatobacteraceae bacterium]
MASRSQQGAPSNVLVLDCTLRDGGYYNDWDYSFDLVKRYVDATAAARIDIVELGFRTLHTNQYLGATAYTTDAFIERLGIPQHLSLAVMLNAKELLQVADQRVAVRSTFSRRNHSQVSMVRIAANRNEVDKLGHSIEELRELGYDVALNLMQISEIEHPHITAFGKQAKTFDVSYAYIADSFGSLRPADIAPIMKALGDGFGTAIGCHLHDNMSYALANTMEAIDAGAVIVDSTIQGMGRGPGNVRTEYLVMELARRGLTTATVQPLVNLVEHDFAELKRTYGWGSSLHYFQSANLAVHPTYVMELTKDDRYSPAEITTALDRLNERGATSFDVRRLTEAVQGEPLQFAGGRNVDDWCTARDVLIVANGPEAHAKKSEIEMFIRQHQPFVLGLNAHLPIDTSLVDAVAVCHPERAMLDASALRDLNCEIVAPSELLASLGITVKRHRDVGMSVTSDGFSSIPSGVGIPDPLVIGYALAVATEGKAKRIFVVGADGYEPADARQRAVENTLRHYALTNTAIPLVSLTKTSLTMEQRSLFAPL